jgi:hypothetical protein
MSGSLRPMSAPGLCIIAHNTNNNSLSLNGKALKAKMSPDTSIITGAQPQLQIWRGARNFEMSWNHDITEKQCFLKFEVPDGAFFTTLKFVVDGTTEQVREAIQEMRPPNYAPTSPSYTPPGSPSESNLKRQYPFTQWSTDSPSYTPPGSPPPGPPSASQGVAEEPVTQRSSKRPKMQIKIPVYAPPPGSPEVTYVPTGPSYSPLPFPLYACAGGGLSFEPPQAPKLKGKRKSERTKKKPTC